MPAMLPFRNRSRGYHPHTPPPELERPNSSNKTLKTPRRTIIWSTYLLAEAKGRKPSDPFTKQDM
jgi:hypothetical protein